MRSQMAEGFLRHMAGDRFRVASAGTEPMGLVLPEVVKAMQEKGIDVSGHTSDPIDPDIVAESAHLIDLGGRARSHLPKAYADKFRDWNVVDPYGLGETSLRNIRDEIERRVQALIEELDA